MDRLNILEIDVAEATTKRPLLVTDDEDVEEECHDAKCAGRAATDGFICAPFPIALNRPASEQTVIWTPTFRGRSCCVTPVSAYVVRRLATSRWSHRWRSARR